MKKDAFHRIHNINEKLNRLLSFPIWIAAFLVMVLMIFCTYRMRILLSLLINVFFNRPAVYLNYLARWVARPLRFVTMSVFYFVVIGIYAFFYRVGKGEAPKPLIDSDPDSDYFQS